MPWHMGPYWHIKWALDNCLISVFVNIQRCLKQTNRQYETKIKGNSSGKRLNNSSCSLQLNAIKSSPKTFRTAKNFRAPLSARMARPINWGQSESVTPPPLHLHAKMLICDFVLQLLFTVLCDSFLPQRYIQNPAIRDRSPQF